MHQNSIEIENKYCTLKHNIYYNYIDSFKHDEDEVIMIPPKYYSYNWIPQFLHQIPELATIELHNECYYKIVYLNPKINHGNVHLLACAINILQLRSRKKFLSTLISMFMM